MIILSILAILLVILIEVFPLFSRAEARFEGQRPLASGGPVLDAGVDEYRELVYTVSPAGIRFFSARDGSAVQAATLEGLGTARVECVSDRGRGALGLGLSDGRVVPVDVQFTTQYTGTEGMRRIEPGLAAGKAAALDPAGRPVRAVSIARGDDSAILAGLVGPREISILFQKRKKALVGPGKLVETRQSIILPGSADATAVLVDGRGDDLIVGLSTGGLVRVDLRDPSLPRVAESVPEVTQGGSRVTVLGYLLGDRSFIVGDAAGGVSRWQLVRPPHGDFVLTRMDAFEPHAAAVTSFSASQRDKGFLTGDAKGGLKLRYATTGRTLLSLSVPSGELQAAAISPKTDGLVAVDAAGGASAWSLRNPHPEITLRSLFGKIWYEGYDRPELVWQSTGGTDDFEAKFSIRPLLFGSLKGMFYALLIAVPISLLSAIYVSQFMHPSSKATVKPLIEVMAGLPSVVLGFIAGLWLAPRVEKVLPGLVLLPWVVGALILLTLWFWRKAPVGVRTRMRPGTEVMVILPLVLVGTAISFTAGGWLESTFLGGDYRDWLRNIFGITYDQRNSVVVGFAMGFAVIPIIFTIAEDSLSNVPGHLTAGSLALGATRWQTAIRVVLPTASPGIFSAIMIGLGRAVGETMIVLMATGNTPLM
ncbi:MAG TPA: ABC transporter permease subunit, partial [Planctomycetota bacterium]|nr:ABC transporter permease subunit [Planctomycetota bacterium]